MEKESFGMLELNRELVDIFAEESENEKTFLGFSDGELSNCDFKDCGSDSDCKSMEQVSPKKSFLGFTLRVALQPTSPFNAGEEEDTSEETKKPLKFKDTLNLEVDGSSESIQNKLPYLCKSDSDSDDDLFLAKRAMNIQANKAMLLQLMADLQKMPGALKNAGYTRKKESRCARISHSSEQQRKPERSRRVTRSMGADDLSTTQGDSELEMSVEEELMKVCGKPQRRACVRPSQRKPYVIRPVEEITEDELQLVAKSMTEKIYNRATGSTCHQCRQKTLDTKTCCRNENCHGIQGQFCGPCLRNRYGEDVKTALLDPQWQCPPCRRICNCSFCRQRDGHCPTGILFPLAQYHGFSDVHSYLCSLHQKLKTGDEDH